MGKQRANYTGESAKVERKYNLTYEVLREGEGVLDKMTPKKQELWIRFILKVLKQPLFLSTFRGTYFERQLYVIRS